MMVEGAEERQLKGPIDVLAPYSYHRRDTTSTGTRRTLGYARKPDP
jgi:hypothetical protein